MQFVVQRFPLFGGYFVHITIYVNPQKQSVIERFPLLGEFVIRGSTVFVLLFASALILSCTLRTYMYVCMYVNGTL